MSEAFNQIGEAFIDVKVNDAGLQKSFDRAGNRASQSIKRMEIQAARANLRYEQSIERMVSNSVRAFDRMLRPIIRIGQIGAVAVGALVIQSAKLAMKGSEAEKSFTKLRNSFKELQKSGGQMMLPGLQKAFEALNKKIKEPAIIAKVLGMFEKLNKYIEGISWDKLFDRIKKFAQFGEAFIKPWIGLGKIVLNVANIVTNTLGSGLGKVLGTATMLLYTFTKIAPIIMSFKNIGDMFQRINIAGMQRSFANNRLTGATGGMGAVGGVGGTREVFPIAASKGFHRVGNGNGKSMLPKRTIEAIQTRINAIDTDNFVQDYTEKKLFGNSQFSSHRQNVSYFGLNQATAFQANRRPSFKDRFGAAASKWGNRLSTGAALGSMMGGTMLAQSGRGGLSTLLGSTLEGAGAGFMMGGPWGAVAGGIADLGISAFSNRGNWKEKDAQNAIQGKSVWAPQWKKAINPMNWFKKDTWMYSDQSGFADRTERFNRKNQEKLKKQFKAIDTDITSKWDEKTEVDSKLYKLQEKNSKFRILSGSGAYGSSFAGGNVAMKDTAELTKQSNKLLQEIKAAIEKRNRMEERVQNASQNEMGS
jgi:hypothetical protein